MLRRATSSFRTPRLAAPLTLLLVFLARALPAQAPAPAAVPPSESWLKFGPSVLVGIPFIGVERTLRHPRRTFQWDVMLSPWKSAQGAPFAFVVGTAEWRYYRRESRDGWYAALNLGAGLFRLQRPDYADTTLYQEGGTVLGGGSVGHVWRLGDGWTLEAYVGGGTTQSLYKGYDMLTHSRYDGAKLWNVSGEALPYRSGVMFGMPWRRR